jgi:hypothetical protein
VGMVSTSGISMLDRNGNLRGTRGSDDGISERRGSARGSGLANRDIGRGQSPGIQTGALGRKGASMAK